MRIALIGSGSFIAHHVARNAAENDLDITAVSRDADLDTVLPGADAAICFSLDPRFRTEPYAEDIDRELAVARASVRHGARFIMLSSRRVYPTERRWNARESDAAGGDETVYGRNKAITEQAVLHATEGKSLVLRLSNIVGFEYDPRGRRGTFMGLLMRSLKETGEIYYDMHPNTQRDFLPVTLCAQSIVEAIRAGAAGKFNLGCGFPVSCGVLGDWIMEGFGGGRLISRSAEIRDSFFLDMTKWRENFSTAITPEQLEADIVALGRRLRDA